MLILLMVAVLIIAFRILVALSKLWAKFVVFILIVLIALVIVLGLII